MALNQSHKFCIAPMMDWTDRHCRALHRLMSARALLYTEMVTADAVLHGDRDRLIGFSPAEHPVALQLGGCDGDKLARATKIAVDLGYDEINLNVGCPSDRVQAGRFGACLMREPALVADVWDAMQTAAGETPVTIKCRLGVDAQSLQEGLFRFVEATARAGCKTFIVHARKAWLEGLSPKENRDVPPLDYGAVRDLKRARPDLEIVLNGGLRDLDHALAEGAELDGVMLGRAAYQNPSLLLEVDSRVFGQPAPCASAIEAVQQFLPYLEAQRARGVSLHAMTRHMLGLFNGKPGGRRWRRALSEGAARGETAVVREALAFVAAPARGFAETESLAV